MSRKQPCEYCGTKLKLSNSRYYRGENGVTIADGDYTALNIGVDEHGRVAMWAAADDYTDFYYPNYCPNCGRKLTKKIS